jgi:hypothetical protein
MSIDLSKMPKLGFGMMRLPQQGNSIDLLKEASGMLDH